MGIKQYSWPSISTGSASVDGKYWGKKCYAVANVYYAGRPTMIACTFFPYFLNNITTLYIAFTLYQVLFK